MRLDPLLLILQVAVFLVLAPSQDVHAQVSCENDNECEEALRIGSKCIEGQCSNPFYHGGCLKSLLPEWDKVRVCTSDDPPEALANGYCRESPFDYMEIRILAQNWESSFFESWILQIVLSEMLDVPVTLETGAPGFSDDFYHPSSALDYNVASADYDELVTAARVGDCRNIKTDDPERYQRCAHFVTEVWSNELSGTQAFNGVEKNLELGALGFQHWHVPKFAADRNPWLTNYVSYQGEANRHKIASMFKRPTTWGQYCSEVSLTNCNSTDDVAARAPVDQDESGRYYLEGLYKGHFRVTNNGDCEKNPLTCTGHFTDYPCGWTSLVTQQTHHLQIPLVSEGSDPSGGYQYGEMAEIWAAANATKSDVIMMWWSPEVLYEAYLGTEAEFTRVLLPPPTQECVSSRLDSATRCAGDAEGWIGDAAGACDTSAQILKKLIAEGLHDSIYNPGIPEALRSPAYKVLQEFRISTLQIGDIFQRWYARDTDRYGFDPRDGVCQWVVDNFDLVQNFVPETYPRVFKVESADSALFLVALILACTATTLAVGSIILVFAQRKTRNIYYAQTESLYPLLVGLLAMAVGAILLTVTPSDGICVSILWLTHLGFVVHVIPVAMRIYAINKLLGTGQITKRVRVKRSKLSRFLFLGVILMSAFLLGWTLSSPPAKLYEYELLTETSEVIQTDACSFSEAEEWEITSLLIHFVLLLPPTIIGSLALRVRENLNDSVQLSLVMFSHILFMIVRGALQVAVSSSETFSSDGMGWLAIALSVDVILSLVVYLGPKVAGNNEAIETEPLPDLFLQTSIIMADVWGFSAWCSVREPVQVFKFLERIFEELDKTAESHRVFKVETVRDYYLAATGIPQAQEDHAVVLAKFAAKCMRKMDILCKKLEMQFGPDTGDLQLRIGLHSGPVTGGLMRGKSSRFQLFGDTVTMTAFINSSGRSGQIHVSEEFANNLIKAGKKKWIREREEELLSESNKKIKTYWLVQGGGVTVKSDEHYDVVSNLGSSTHFSDDVEGYDEIDSEARWVEFNVKILEDLLRQILAQRESSSFQVGKAAGGSAAFSLDGSHHQTTPLEEVKTIIELPEFDKKAARRLRENKDSVVISDKVLGQLKSLVAMIAKMYNNNPFHNFAHASYVVMAVVKYMNRIKEASEMGTNIEDYERSSTQAALHDHTYGITSDPLTQFACVFSALIHDVDHPGVPNPQLINENGRLAQIYNERSVAEQNSFDLAWELLMDDAYLELRTTLCRTPNEMQRFRQLVVNSVMATDISDKMLKELRNNRWDKAFSDSSSSREYEDPRLTVNRKATIVIEHLIQAADIAHTCQHWNIYRKWNERLFEECYVAYKSGRADKNPAEYWYKGELGFFDFYIVPLSQKLLDCGVFGPTGDENLNYAFSNRSQWEKDGKAIVEEMLAKIETKYESNGEKLDLALGSE